MTTSTILAPLPCYLILFCVSRYKQVARSRSYDLDYIYYYHCCYYYYYCHYKIKHCWSRLPDALIHWEHSYGARCRLGDETVEMREHGALKGSMVGLWSVLYRARSRETVSECKAIYSYTGLPHRNAIYYTLLKA